MKWTKRNLSRHFDKHPDKECCWEEFVGHPINVREYETSSFQTADWSIRCRVEYRSQKVEYDCLLREAYSEEETRHFVDGVNFTTIADVKSGLVKTHFHIHWTGKAATHESGSTFRPFDAQLDDFVDWIHAQHRNQKLEGLKFDRFAEEVPAPIQAALRGLKR
jgi:hypothetical protein